MKLENKNAVIYGAGGAIGSTVAKAFAREGAKVFLTGRNLASVAATAGEIIAAGGTAEAAQVDALDEGAVEGHIAAVVEKAGTVDISFNAIAPVPQPTYSRFHNLACRCGRFHDESGRESLLDKKDRGSLQLIRNEGSDSV